ncbi:hypothetical protein KR074_009266 [Drosophila pseudoananassae]|nr:hypothetical protein KR074_009266 [Drosophila pseudoananassae]
MRNFTRWTIILGAGILLSLQALGDTIDEICSKWSGNKGNSGNNNDDLFQVGHKSDIACLMGYASAAENFGSTTRYITDSTTCYGYYVCEREDAIGIWDRCPMDTQFDPALGKCVMPFSYSCPYNRCNNVYAAYMAFVNTDCKEYTECSTGSKLLCPVNRPYYDEVNQQCSDVMPNYAVCTVFYTK